MGRTNPGLVRPVGLVATPARGLFVLDDVEGIVNLAETDGAFTGRTSVRAQAIGGVRGRVVGISTIAGFVVVAKTTDLDQLDSVSLFAGFPLTYVSSFKVGSHIEGVAGGYDGTIWALTQNRLDHFTTTGRLLESIPIIGSALDTTADGSIWVTRQDGIHRIGSNGGPIPPDMYGHSICGAPKISHSIPATQPISQTHQLLIAASCNEACTLKASGTLSIPGVRAVYTLVAHTHRIVLDSGSTCRSVSLQKGSAPSTAF